jgi:hypothetical protein
VILKTYSYTFRSTLISARARQMSL